jgi:hypothetical protein
MSFIEYFSMTIRCVGIGRFDGLPFFDITALAGRSRAMIVKWETYPFIRCILQTVQTGLAAQTGLGHQAVCAYTQGRKERNEYVDYFSMFHKDPATG